MCWEYCGKPDSLVSVSLGLGMTSVAYFFPFQFYVHWDQTRTALGFKYSVWTCKISDNKGGSMNLTNKVSEPCHQHIRGWWRNWVEEFSSIAPLWRVDDYEENMKSRWEYLLTANMKFLFPSVEWSKNTRERCRLEMGRGRENRWLHFGWAKSCPSNKFITKSQRCNPTGF